MTSQAPVTTQAPVESHLLSHAPVSSASHRSLRRLVGIMIPPDDELGVPGADDPLIFADLVRNSSRSARSIEAVLKRLDEFSGGVFADLRIDHQQTLAERFLEAPAAQLGPELSALFALVLQCYYRDDRVMHSIGMEVRPPFPKGFEVEQGDWSLLEPVRARQKIYRDAP